MKLTCTKCKTEKEASEFHKQSARKCGYTSNCKACVKLYNAKRYRKNPEKAKAASAKYRKENLEKVKAGQARWYKEMKRENS